MDRTLPQINMHYSALFHVIFSHLLERYALAHIYTALAATYVFAFVNFAQILMLSLQ